MFSTDIQVSLLLVREFLFFIFCIQVENCPSATSTSACNVAAIVAVDSFQNRAVSHDLILQLCF
jgi:hypothetical protein